MDFMCIQAWRKASSAEMMLHGGCNGDGHRSANGNAKPEKRGGRQTLRGHQDGVWRRLPALRGHDRGVFSFFAGFDRKFHTKSAIAVLCSLKAAGHRPEEKSSGFFAALRWWKTSLRMLAYKDRMGKRPLVEGRFYAVLFRGNF